MTPVMHASQVGELTMWPFYDDAAIALAAKQAEANADLAAKVMGGQMVVVGTMAIALFTMLRPSGAKGDVMGGDPMGAVDDSDDDEEEEGVATTRADGATEARVALATLGAGTAIMVAAMAVSYA